MNPEKIGKIIATQRMNKHLTQQQLADRLGVTNKAVSNWERGRAIPDVGLFDSICKELELTINELLNGEKGKSNSKGLVDYLKYYKKKNFILFTGLLMLVIIFAILFLFFINNYNKYVAYELNGESEHFTYDSGLVNITRDKYILSFGNITVKSNDYVEEKDLLDVSLKYQDKTIVGGKELFKKNVITVEKVGYNEIFNDNKIKNIKDWYIIVTYKKDKEIKEEIDLNVNKIYQNNLFFKKDVDSVSTNEDGEYNDPEEITDEDKKIVQKLKDKGFVETDYSPYVLVNSYNDNTMIVKVTLDIVTYKTKNVKYDYSYGRSKMLRVEGDDYSYRFDELTENVTCEFGNCPPDAWELSKNFINLWNEIIN